MKYNPEFHHRRSIRLKGYDYSLPGAYFVTLVTKGRECIFGEIIDGNLITNLYGSIVERAWKDLPHHYPNVTLDEFIIMPNHFHGIIILNDSYRGGSCVISNSSSPNENPHRHEQDEVEQTRPYETRPIPRMGGSCVISNPSSPNENPHKHEGDEVEQTRPYESRPIPHRGGSCVISNSSSINENPHRHERDEFGQTRPYGKKYGLSEIVRALKSFSARRINKNRNTPGIAIWQQNYFERIIRNEKELDQIRLYIMENPHQWDEDEENPGNM